MSGPDFPWYRLLGPATVHDERAAWMERAPRRGVQQGWGETRDTTQLALTIERGQTCDQELSIRVQWLAKELSRRRDLH